VAVGLSGASASDLLEFNDLFDHPSAMASSLYAAGMHADLTH
jgi:hypothetical protein